MAANAYPRAVREQGDGLTIGHRAKRNGNQTPRKRIYKNLSHARGTKKNDAERYRALVGRVQVWRSLDTTERKTAGTRFAQPSAEAEWKHREAALRDKDMPAAAQHPVVPKARL